ncbi:MAG: ribosomal methyltransferase KsgA/Dim1 family protein [Nocardioides sp.]|uniref:class I SAM-dependent methyltransferase n=1 Tax=Nocardioides sp. TaxID=35761 RepID=UPI00262060BE|nr:class I SAM-dependent methyltransferase [Nocardioides sp.]MCW2833262.1 ribosomal methyltransferase KsgA/Dim1 family protein [Nocardioides sp.]
MTRPPTRWELAGERNRGYAESFATRVADGSDIDGEARLADAMVPRGARILDVGSGMGRVAAALAARGHEVVATEPDAALREQSRATYADLDVLPHQALDLPELPGFDLVLLVGNVLIYLGQDTERHVLAHLRSLLAPGGRVLAGFHLHGTRQGSRVYPADEFVADVEAAGLRVDWRFGSYELHPPNDEYAVWVLSAAGGEPA